MAHSGSVWTIANGQTVSNDVRLPGPELVALLIDSGFDGTTITFKGSEDDVTYLDIQSADGTLFIVTTALSRRVQLGPADFLGVKFLRLTAGTSQTGATVITPVFSDVV